MKEVITNQTVSNNKNRPYCFVTEGELVADVPQYIKLGQQCLDRIMTFLDSSQQSEYAIHHHRFKEDVYIFNM